METVLKDQDKKQKKQLLAQYIIERVINYYLTDYSNQSPELRFDRMNNFGRLIEANHIYLFSHGHGQAGFTIKYHWANPVSPYADATLPFILSSHLNKWIKSLQNKEIVIRHKLKIRIHSEGQNVPPRVLSLILVPIFINDSLHNVFCIEHGGNRQWTETILPAVKFVSSMIRMKIEIKLPENPVKKIQKHQNLFLHKPRLEAIGILTAGIIHEINQPVTAISMGIENLMIRLNEGKLNKDYITEKCRIINTQLQRISSIISHIRIFSKEPKFVQLEMINVNQIILNTLSMFRSQSIKQNITVITELDPDTGQILGDCCEFEQIVINLFSNARDAVNQKEKSMQNEGYEKTIILKTTRSDFSIIFEVTDNGVGIPEENFSRLFEPFFTTKDEENGTGLGLTILQTLVNEMKGNISVDSKVNEFTTFKIRLPSIDPLKN
ncbi:MAG: HAMP domain-containing sensor histidine kinase [Bacteroidetes bacterium]|nr:HAMP domain-containing sensor histidine kinase [Bacteroidota bacterium]